MPWAVNGAGGGGGGGWGELKGTLQPSTGGEGGRSEMVGRRRTSARCKEQFKSSQVLFH